MSRRTTTALSATYRRTDTTWLAWRLAALARLAGPALTPHAPLATNTAPWYFRLRACNKSTPSTATPNSSNCNMLDARQMRVVCRGVLLVVFLQRLWHWNSWGPHWVAVAVAVALAAAAHGIGLRLDGARPYSPQAPACWRRQGQRLPGWMTVWLQDSAPHCLVAYDARLASRPLCSAGCSPAWLPDYQPVCLPARLPTHLPAFLAWLPHGLAVSRTLRLTSCLQYKMLNDNLLIPKRTWDSSLLTD